MKLTFIGTGNAFSLEDYQSNMVIEKNGKKLLIDCGGFAPFALRDAFGIHGGNVGQEIDAVYISHLHADHIGGLEWLALSTKFNPASKKLTLYTMREIMEEMWEDSLKGGLETLQGELSNLTTYFDCSPLKKNEWFEWEGLKFMSVQTIHVVGGFKFMNSYGLMIKTGRASRTRNACEEQIFLTTDTQDKPDQLVDFYEQADVIFHDCETTPHKSRVHAHYTELLEHPEETRKKMWLYHYAPGEKPDAEADGFAGFVKKGQTFEFEVEGDEIE